MVGYYIERLFCDLFLLQWVQKNMRGIFASLRAQKCVYKPMF